MMLALAIIIGGLLAAVWLICAIGLIWAARRAGERNLLVYLACIFWPIVGLCFGIFDVLVARRKASR